MGSLERESYVLLNTKLAEFDFPDEPEATHKWTGTRGIPISGAWAKFVFSTLFGEISFYTTKDIIGFGPIPAVGVTPAGGQSYACLAEDAENEGGITVVAVAICLDITP